MGTLPSLEPIVSNLINPVFPVSLSLFGIIFERTSFVSLFTMIFSPVFLSVLTSRSFSSLPVSLLITISFPVLGFLETTKSVHIIGTLLGFDSSFGSIFINSCFPDSRFSKPITFSIFSLVFLSTKIGSFVVSSIV